MLATWNTLKRARNIMQIKPIDHVFLESINNERMKIAHTAHHSRKWHKNHPELRVPVTVIDGYM
jgi:hypothetical protein